MDTEKIKEEDLYEAYKEHLRDNFKRDNEEIINKAKLSKIKMERDEKIRLFAARIKELVKKAYPEDDAKEREKRVFEIIQERIPVHLNQWMSDGHKTLEAFLKDAVAAEARQIKHETLPSNAPGHAIKPMLKTQPVYAVDAEDHEQGNWIATKDGNNANRTPIVRSNFTPMGTQQPRQGPSYNAPRGNDQPRMNQWNQQGPASQVCYNCGRPGHYSRSCRQPRIQNQQGPPRYANQFQNLPQRPQNGRRGGLQYGSSGQQALPFASAACPGCEFMMHIGLSCEQNRQMIYQMIQMSQARERQQQPYFGMPGGGFMQQPNEHANFVGMQRQTNQMSIQDGPRIEEVRSTADATRISRNTRFIPPATHTRMDDQGKEHMGAVNAGRQKPNPSDPQARATPLTTEQIKELMNGVAIMKSKVFKQDEVDDEEIVMAITSTSSKPKHQEEEPKQSIEDRLEAIEEGISKLTTAVNNIMKEATRWTLRKEHDFNPREAQQMQRGQGPTSRQDERQDFKPKQQEQASGSPVECFNCGRRGHFARKCPFPRRQPMQMRPMPQGQAPTPREELCYKCNRPGHLSRTCRTRNDKRR